MHLAASRAERAYEITGSSDLHLWQVAARSVLGWQRALAGDREGLTIIEGAWKSWPRLPGAILTNALRYGSWMPAYR